MDWYGEVRWEFLWGCNRMLRDGIRNKPFPVWLNKELSEGQQQGVLAQTFEQKKNPTVFELSKRSQIHICTFVLVTRQERCHTMCVWARISEKSLSTLARNVDPLFYGVFFSIILCLIPMAVLLETQVELVYHESKGKLKGFARLLTSGLVSGFLSFTLSFGTQSFPLEMRSLCSSQV